MCSRLSLWAGTRAWARHHRVPNLPSNARCTVAASAASSATVTRPCTGVPGLIASARAQAQTTVTFAGWAFEPQVVEANVKRFMEQNPDLKVVCTPLDLNLFAAILTSTIAAKTLPVVVAGFATDVTTERTLIDSRSTPS